MSRIGRGRSRLRWQRRALVARAVVPGGETPAKLRRWRLPERRGRHAERSEGHPVYDLGKGGSGPVFEKYAEQSISVI